MSIYQGITECGIPPFAALFIYSKQDLPISVQILDLATVTLAMEIHVDSLMGALLPLVTGIGVWASCTWTR